MRLTPFVSRSRPCRDGPVFALSVALVSFGILFTLLSAIELGGVFVGIGVATFGLCLLMAAQPTATTNATKQRLTIQPDISMPPG